MWFCVLAAFVFTQFDVYWFLRWLITMILSKVRPKIGIYDESTLYSICYTTDIDYFFHMNNSKYFREFDFGRFDYIYRSGILKGANLNKKCYILQHAATIRYRKSVNFLMPFKVLTKLVYFDARSFYFEQKVVSIPDNFVRTVALCKNTAVNLDVIDFMKKNHGIDPPTEIPQDLSLWNQSNEVSSGKLRRSGASYADLKKE